MADDRAFDKPFYSAYIWKRLTEIKEKKWLTFQELADRLWVKNPYLVRVFNGTNTSTTEKWAEIAKEMWVEKEEFDKIASEAKRSEYTNSVWETPYKIEDFDVALSREFWVSDEKAIRDIKKYIKFIKENYEDDEK